MLYLDPRVPYSIPLISNKGENLFPWNEGRIQKFVFVVVEMLEQSQD